MTRERYVALALAHVRSPWSTDVARWSTAGALPLELVKCLSVSEVRARLSSGRSFSALLIDATSGQVDRDLVDLANAKGAAVLVVDEHPTARGLDRARSQRRALAPLRSRRPPRGAERAHQDDRRRRRAARPTTSSRWSPDGGAAWWRSPGGAAPARRRWRWRWPRASATMPATPGSSPSPTAPSTPTRRCSTTPATSCPACRSWSSRTGRASRRRTRSDALTFAVGQPRLPPPARPASPP